MLQSQISTNEGNPQKLIDLFGKKLKQSFFQVVCFSKLVKKFAKNL